MSESERVPSMVVCMLAIVSMLAEIHLAQGSPHPQWPADSPQLMKEKIEPAPGRTDEIDARRESYLCDELESALQRGRADGDSSVLDECESLLRRILALPKPGATTLSLCAMAANAMGRPQQAIEILKNAIAEYPEEHVWGPILPLRISGHFRIGAIAARTGDANEAIQAYKTILGNLGDLESSRLDEFLCHMHLAELLRQIPGKEQAATESLQEAMRIAEGFGVGAAREDDILNARFLKGWAAYEWARLQPDEASAEPGPDPNALPSLSSCWMFAMVWASISCPSLPEMELMAGSDRHSTLRVLARLGLATIYIEDSSLNPPKAERYLLNVASDDSYFKPYAEATLPFVYEDMKQIREGIPMLLNDLRHGDFEQREDAAFRLCRSMGPEGIEALQQAQQDPDEYVRYEAACTLARWGRDPTIQPNFRTILDAFMEEDPEIRSKARSAVAAVSSCLEMGLREIVALIGLMDEHCSTELMWATSEVLFSAKLNVQEAALPELTSLTNHESAEVREGAVEIYDRIADSLLMRLEIEEESTQVKIIGILGRLSPVADRIVFRLTPYTRHDNPDVRNAAIDALKNLSTVDKSQAPEDRRAPEEN